MEKFNEFKAQLDCFTGYLSADPEIRYFESGKCKTTFSIPLSKSKDSETVWLNAEMWGKLAEKTAESYKKGDQVLVFGNLKEQEYKSKEGETKKKIIFSVLGIM